MKQYLIIAVIFLLFGGCTTHKKILKSQSELKIEKNIDSTKEISDTKTSIKLGKSIVNESSTVEEISIKKPVDVELTANFMIDTTATLRGDTAIKLVDVRDKNVSVTIYQNGKNGQLTAKIKSKHSVEDVPFSEINIKKTSSTKSTQIDTSKIDSSKVAAKSALKDKSKVQVSSSTIQNDTEKVNYLGLVGLVAVIGLIFWWLSRG